MVKVMRPLVTHLTRSHFGAFLSLKESSSLAGSDLIMQFKYVKCFMAKRSQGMLDAQFVINQKNPSSMLSVYVIERGPPGLDPI